MTHAGGRPTKYNAGMIKTARDYIDDCPDFVPSLCALSMELGVTKRTLMGWKALKPEDLDEKDYPRFTEFLHILHELQSFQERSALNGGADGTWNSAISKLLLGKHGYSDQTNLKGDIRVNITK